MENNTDIPAPPIIPEGSKVYYGYIMSLRQNEWGAYISLQPFHGKEISGKIHNLEINRAAQAFLSGNTIGIAIF